MPQGEEVQVDNQREMQIDKCSQEQPSQPITNAQRPRTVSFQASNEVLVPSTSGDNRPSTSKNNGRTQE